MISDKSQREGATRYFARVTFLCSVVALITVLSVSVRALRYVSCSVRVCTDLLGWMAGRSAGAGRLPSDQYRAQCAYLGILNQTGKLILRVFVYDPSLKRDHGAAGPV